MDVYDSAHDAYSAMEGPLYLMGTDVLGANITTRATPVQIAACRAAGQQALAAGAAATAAYVAARTAASQYPAFASQILTQGQQTGQAGQAATYAGQAATNFASKAKSSPASLASAQATATTAAQAATLATQQLAALMLAVVNYSQSESSDYGADWGDTSSADEANVDWGE